MPATPTLTINQATKAAGDSNVRIGTDFGDEPQVIALMTDPDTGAYIPGNVAILTGDVIASGTGTLPTISGVQLDNPYQLSCLVSGGVPGQAYNLVYTVTLNDTDSTGLYRVGALIVK